jgi:prepilin-type N-terminal cleavage/methylation domain-containing protein
MKKAFTLIELLVVIAIIAILAAILFPVFAQAKAAAKKTADLSNTKQIGTAVQIYLNDSDDTYPSAYYYINNLNSSGGYAHWSGVLQPYVKNTDMFVSPIDELRGMAPTNFVGDNRGQGAPSGQTSQNPVLDNQVPRLSYVGNAALMPRKRKDIDPANVVSATAVDGVSQTILVGPLTSIPACINDTSAASGVAFKSHRPANAFLRPNLAPFVGESVADLTADSYYYAITVDQAKTALSSCRANSALGLSHIVYSAPYRFGGSDQKPAEGGANYTFADSSARYLSLPATLNVQNYRWGKANYGAGGKPVLDQVSGNQVQ